MRRPAGDVELIDDRPRRARPDVACCGARSRTPTRGVQPGSQLRLRRRSAAEDPGARPLHAAGRGAGRRACACRSPARWPSTSERDADERATAEARRRHRMLDAAVPCLLARARPRRQPASSRRRRCCARRSTRWSSTWSSPTSTAASCRRSPPTTSRSSSAASGRRSARSPRCRCRWCGRCRRPRRSPASDVRTNQRRPEGRIYVARARRPPRRRRPDRRRCRTRPATFLNRQVQAGDLVAVVTTTGVGGAFQDFTEDAALASAAIDRFVGRQPGETAALQQTAEDAFVGPRRPDAGAARRSRRPRRGRRRPVGEPGRSQPGRVGVRRPQRRSDGGAAQLDGDHRRRRHRPTTTTPPSRRWSGRASRCARCARSPTGSAASPAGARRSCTSARACR